MAANGLNWLITNFIIMIFFAFEFFRFIRNSLPSNLRFYSIVLLRNSVLSIIIIVRSRIFVFFAFSFFIQRYTTCTTTRHSFIIKLLQLKSWSDFRMIKFRLLWWTSRLIMWWRHLSNLSFICLFFHWHFTCIVKFI